jgi:hypothetical protein
MKSKVLMLAAVLTLCFSANAFAAAAAAGWLARSADGSFAWTVTNTITPFSVKPSANVWIAYGGETTGVSYSLGTLHTSGTFTYATTSTDTNIYRFANAVQTSATQGAGTYGGSGQLPLASPPDATSAISWTAGWTASK